MSLIKCPNCGHEISDKAIQCPKCKAYQAEKNKRKYSNDSLKKKLNVKEIIYNEDKFRILAIIVLLIFIIALIFIALSDSKSSVNTSKKKHIGYVDEQLEMTDEEKIEKASELFGKEVEDGSVSCSQDFVDFAEQATLFGHDVEITPIISNGITSDIVDTVMWTTQDTIDKEDLNNIVESLCELYGEYDESDIDYKEIQDGYQWEEPSDYSLVACGMNEDKDEIIMYWVE